MSKRTVLVTGGTGGIGTAICREMADDDTTIVAGFYPSDAQQAIDWQDANEKLGFDFKIVPVDVSDYESAKSMVLEVEKAYGSIDVLVNCAGITRDKTLRRMSPEQWQDVIDTNLSSAFNITQPVIDGMIERGYGRVINIASVNGQKGQFGQANYSAAKAGLHGFTMAVAQETASKGITVNTVSPGYVATPMTSSMNSEVLSEIVKQVPVGRMANPEEIAFTVAWLADERNAYVTGANIPVNGGMFMSA